MNGIRHAGFSGFLNEYIYICTEEVRGLMSRRGDVRALVNGPGRGTPVIHRVGSVDIRFCFTIRPGVSYKATYRVFWV